MVKDMKARGIPVDGVGKFGSRTFASCLPTTSFFTCTPAASKYVLDFLANGEWVIKERE